MYSKAVLISVGVLLIIINKLINKILQCEKVISNSDSSTPLAKRPNLTATERLRSILGV